MKREKRVEKYMLTTNDILTFLQNAGIRQDNKVTVHCSLRSIGKIENGADGLIDAFCGYLSDGLFIVPTHTWDTVVRAHPVYDVLTTMPCIGTLAKVAAFRPDAVRSLHPTHSVAVFPITVTLSSSIMRSIIASCCALLIGAKNQDGCFGGAGIELTGKTAKVTLIDNNGISEQFEIKL